MFAQLADPRPGKALVPVNPFGPAYLGGDRGHIDRAIASMTVVTGGAPEAPDAWTVKVEFVALDEGCPVLLAAFETKRRVRVLIDREQPRWPLALQVAVEYYRQGAPAQAMDALDDAVHDHLAGQPLNPAPAPACTRAFGYTRTVPWCTTGHADHDHPEDRQHCGDFLTVDLSQEPGETDVDGTFWRSQAAAYLRQHDRHDAPIIELGRVDERGMELTVDEAEALANNLLCLVAAARNAQDLA